MAKKTSQLDKLTGSERLKLVKFVCSFAWADLEVRPEERAFVSGLVKRLELSAEERKQVGEWLRVPPGPDAVDPMQVPMEHRKLFVEAVEGVIAADGEIAPEEHESLQIFQALLA